MTKKGKSFQLRVTDNRTEFDSMTIYSAKFGYVEECNRVIEQKLIKHGRRKFCILGMTVDKLYRLQRNGNYGSGVYYELYDKSTNEWRGMMEYHEFLKMHLWDPNDV